LFEAACLKLVFACHVAQVQQHPISNIPLATALVQTKFSFCIGIMRVSESPVLEFDHQQCAEVHVADLA